MSAGLSWAVFTPLSGEQQAPAPPGDHEDYGLFADLSQCGEMFQRALAAFREGCSSCSPS
jgi:hypothetical protein